MRLNRTQLWRYAGAWLLALALLVRLAAPTGWMLAPDAQGAPQLVICTGHGPMTLDAGKGSAPAPKTVSDHPCAFAGCGVAPPPTLSAEPIPAPVATAPAQSLGIANDQRPGRGLAAPPPPSRGPPSFT
jgi:hypothetical protein